MISYIKGIAAEKFEDSLIVENGGIGYQIMVPTPVLDDTVVGEEICIHTYLYTREDLLCLYGFSSREDLSLFRLLIGVSGIGPKGALAILSVISPEDLRFAILADDAKTISQAPGVGLKTAKKLILELKDKMHLEEAFELKSAKEQKKNGKADDAEKDSRQEAREALVALGYSMSEAVKAIRSIPDAEQMDTEAIIKAALKKMVFF